MIQISAIGRVGKDPETKDFNGKIVGNFSIGIDTGFGDDKKTIWVNCSIWNREKLLPFIKKGTKVFVQGQPKIRAWADKSGNPCAGLEMTVNILEILDSKKEETKIESAPIDEKPISYDLPF